MNAKEIRKLVLEGRSSDIRGLLLTKGQINLVKSVSNGALISAKQLSMRLGISIQHASSKLNVLFHKGYIDRDTSSASSGGIEYLYKSKIN